VFVTGRVLPNEDFGKGVGCQHKTLPVFCPEGNGRLVRGQIFRLEELASGFVDFDSKDRNVVNRALLDNVQDLRKRKGQLTPMLRMAAAFMDSIISMLLFNWLADGLHGGD
jgi:hypothetical protein